MSSVGRLTAKERRFIEEYLITLDPRRAALAAGYSPAMAASKAYQWVSDSKSKPHVYSAIEQARTERTQRTQICADMVLRRLWAIATADPNDIISHLRGACRHCYGVGHAYQWIDENEFRALRDEVTTPGASDAAGASGYGYDMTVKPNVTCPHCRGEGVGRVRVADTTNLDGSARLLFAGVKRTRDGVEVKLHDQLKALEMVARHLGMFNDKVTLRGEAGNPLELLVRQIQGSSFMPCARPEVAYGD